MASEVARYGGVDVVGAPITDRFWYSGFLTQAFEKLVLQWQPDLGQAVPVNVFDDLHAAGADAWLDAARLVPPAADSTADAGLDWDATYARHLALLDAYPPLRDFYLANPNALDTFGLPMSVKDYGPVVSLRLQRATLQLWTVDTPWATAGSVVVANAGNLAQEAGLWRPTPSDQAALVP